MSTPSSDKPALGVDTATAATAWAIDPAAAASSADWGLASAVASTWRPQLPYRSRPRPRVYGKGRYGVDRYDSRDDTRYSWSRVAVPLAVLFLGLFGFSPAHATNAYCESADATTTGLSLCKPATDVEGANAWGDKWNTNADMLDAELLSIISGAALAAGSIDTTKLASDAVTTAKILDGQVTTQKLASGAIDTTKLAADAVTTSKVLDAQITTQKLAALSVDTGKLAADAVDTAKIRDFSVTANKIAAAAIDTTKLAADAVVTASILDGQVTAQKLSVGALDTTKIASDAITTAKILDAQVTGQKIAASSIDTSKFNITLIADNFSPARALVYCDDPNACPTPKWTGDSVSTAANSANSIAQRTGTGLLDVRGFPNTVTAVSSLTVQGNAFSVGGATLSVVSGQTIFGPVPIAMNNGADLSAVAMSSGPLVVHSTAATGNPAFIVYRNNGLTNTGGYSISALDSGSVTMPNVVTIGQNQGANIKTIANTGGLTSQTVITVASVTVGSVLTVYSTAAVVGNAFGVGTSTFAVSAGSVGIGMVPAAASTSTVQLVGDMSISAGPTTIGQLSVSSKTTVAISSAPVFYASETSSLCAAVTQSGYMFQGGPTTKVHGLIAESSSGGLATCANGTVNQRMLGSNTDFGAATANFPQMNGVVMSLTVPGLRGVATSLGGSAKAGYSVINGTSAVIVDVDNTATTAAKFYNGGIDFLQQFNLPSSSLTVGGNAFSVGGSTLIINAGQVAIGTNVVSDNYASFTDSGTSVFYSTASGQIITDWRNYKGSTMFKFMDSGELDVGGSAGSATQVLTSNGAGAAPTWAAASGGVLASTRTYPNMSTTNSVRGFGLTHSTGTITTGANGVMICFAGDVAASGVANVRIGFLVDGIDAPVANGSDMCHYVVAVNSPVNCSSCIMTKTSLSAGSHDFAIWGATDSGTLAVPFDSSSMAQMWVMELNTGAY